MYPWGGKNSALINSSLICLLLDDSMTKNAIGYKLQKNQQMVKVP